MRSHVLAASSLLFLAASASQVLAAPPGLGYVPPGAYPRTGVSASFVSGRRCGYGYPPHHKIRLGYPGYHRHYRPTGCRPYPVYWPSHGVYYRGYVPRPTCGNRWGGSVWFNY